MTPQAPLSLHYAHQLSEHYLSIVERIQRSGKRSLAGDIIYEEDALSLALGEAEQVAESLLDAVDQAVDDCRSVGLEIPRGNVHTPRPALEPGYLTRMRFSDARAARDQLAGMKSLWPNESWDGSDPQGGVDLFASKKKALYIALAVLVVAAIVFAFISPGTAAGVGAVALFVAVKVWLRLR